MSSKKAKYQAFSVANEAIWEATDKLRDAVFNEEKVGDNERVVLKALVIKMFIFLEILQLNIGEREKSSVIFVAEHLNEIEIDTEPEVYPHEL